MINHKQLYDAFNACKKIYGTDKVHVNLIAKQLGVLAINVINYINDHETLVKTRYDVANSGYFKPGNMHYSGLYVADVNAIPFISTNTKLIVGDNGATVNINVTGDSFKTSTSTSNWSIDAGHTGLTLSSVGSGTTSKALTFIGTVKAGTISIQCKAAGMAKGIASDVLYLDIANPDFSYDTFNTINSNISKLMYPPINVIDLSVYGKDYNISEENQTVIITDNATEAYDVLLPAGSVGLKIIVVNKDDAGVNVIPDGTDTIDGLTTLTVSADSSSTLLCYESGKWITI